MGVVLYNLKESKKLNKGKMFYDEMTSLGYPYSFWNPTHYVLFESVKELINKNECDPKYLNKVRDDDNGKINGRILRKIIKTDFYNEFKNELFHHNISDKIENFYSPKSVDSQFCKEYNPIDDMEYLNFKEIKIDPVVIMSTMDILDFLEHNRKDGIRYC
jgi:hypothetical protein